MTKAIKIKQNMKILIVTHFYPPVNSIASLRPYAWAKYWSRMGHEVCILTTRKETFDQPLNLEINHKDDEIRIETVKYWPFSNYELVQHHQEIESKNKTSYFRKLIDQTKRIRKNIGTGNLINIRMLWILPAIKAALSIYRNWNYDVVVSTCGPPASHIIASLIKDKLPVVWAADYRDLWFGDPVVESKGVFAAIENQIEKYFVSRSDLITTVSEPLQQDLAARFGHKTIVIENGFDPEERPVKIDYFKQENETFKKIRLIYTGTLYLGKRDPSILFEAVNQLVKGKILDQSKLEILFYGWNLANLPDLISAYKLHGIVKIGPFVNREEVLQIQQNADALIFLDWGDSSIPGMVTGKLFEYMYSGRPILGIGSTAKTSAGQLIEEARIGYNLGKSPEKISSLICQMLGDHELPYEPNLQVLNKYTRKYLSEKMINSIVKIFD